MVAKGSRQLRITEESHGVLDLQTGSTHRRQGQIHPRSPGASKEKDLPAAGDSELETIYLDGSEVGLLGIHRLVREGRAIYIQVTARQQVKT